MGGHLKQYQVLTSPALLARQDITLWQLTTAVEKPDLLAGGGVFEREARESLLRLSGRAVTLADIEETPVVWRGDRAVRVREVADVAFGGPVRRGDGSVRVKDGDRLVGGGSVILAVQR